MRCSTVMFMLVSLVSALSAPGDESAVSFHREIRPIFQEKCQGCHQPARGLGGYIITTAAARQAAGDSGEFAIVPGDPDASYLLSQIETIDGVAEMPKNGEPLSEEQQALVRRWIAEGAQDDSPAAQTSYDEKHPPTYQRLPQITSLDYSPDGKLLAVSGFHEVLLHQASQPVAGEPLARLIGLSERIESVRFSPDGRLLAVTGGSPGRSGEVQVWNVAKRTLSLSIPVTFDTVFGASWSPDSRLLAFGCTDNTVRVIEVATGEQVLFQAAHSDWVLDTVFSADGSHMASVGRDATAKLIEVPTERFVDNITSITPGALRGGINAVARHPLRDEILFGGADGLPKIYRMHRQTKRVIGDDANLLWELPSLPGRIFSVDYGSGGKLLAAGSSLDGHGAVHLYTMEAAPSLPDAIRDILFRPTHERTAEDRQQLQQHFDTGVETLWTASIETGGIYTVSIHPEGSAVAAAGADGRVKIIDVATGATVHDFAPVALAAADTTVASSINSSSPHGPQADPLMPAQQQGERSKPLAAVKLTALPARIDLKSSAATVQLVVLAKLETGETVDVTRDVQLASNEIVHASPFGSITPLANGNTSLIVSLGDLSTEIPVDVDGMEMPLHPDYVRDVAPVFARAGCNAGTCHGAQDGKHGFKLSLRGYDPVFDVRALTDDLGSRRTNLASPGDSLFLLKPTGVVPHEGGVVLREHSHHYRTLLAWVRDGATLDLGSTGVSRIEVQPMNPSITETGSRIQMRVVAYYPDGSQRDVTRDAFIESGDREIAATNGEHPGLITVLRRGEAPVLVRYEGAYAATTLTVIGDREGFASELPPTNNRIDELVNAKLARTQTSVAPACDDYTFLRRIYLDLTGLPPTPAVIESFTSDPRDSDLKRQSLIDKLVGSSEYVEHWTNKWADLLQVNGKFLGRDGATRFRDWIRQRIDANTPYDEFARSILTATGSNKDNPAASYFKILREPEATMENTTQLFLATRFNCNKCHDHPFERWTQDQYYELAAYFAQVDLQPDAQSGEAKVGGTAVEGAKTLYEIIADKSEGEMVHPRTSEVVAPAFPFDCDHSQDRGASRREQLANWMVSEHNPYFAKSYANRIWAYLTGRGLIEPIDDIRAGNPATNPELLDWLTEQFVQSGFDTQHLMRLICKSSTYQRSLATDAFNSDDTLNYSHARARRLSAEVLYDAIYQTTGAKSSFPDLPENMRAAALPDVGIKLPDGFLNNLGRPPRESACECERSADLQMGPVMSLINGATVGGAISQAGNAIEQLTIEGHDDRQLIERLFMRILNRPANPAEIDDALRLFETIEQQHVMLGSQLAMYEIELEPIMAQRELARVTALQEKQVQLVKHVAEHAEERQRLEDERIARIKKAEAARDNVRGELLAEMPAWLKTQQATSWEILEAQSITSDLGETFEVQADGSIFVTGGSGKVGSNRFFAAADLMGITALRLEAVADERLPANGPGKAPNGNFVVSELELSVAPERSPRELIRQWDFANDLQAWQPGEHVVANAADGRLTIAGKAGAAGPRRLTVPIELAPGAMQLELTTRLASQTTIHVVWRTAEGGEFDRAQAVSMTVAGGRPRWLTLQLPFMTESAVTGLAIEFDGAEDAIEIDSLRLVKGTPSEYQRLELTNAQADYGQPNHTIDQSIDGVRDDNRGWAIDPQQGRAHVATFDLADATELTGEGLIQVELAHRHNSKNHSLGRFRLAVTRSPLPVTPGLPPEILAIANKNSEGRTAEEERQLADHFLATRERYSESEAAVATAKQPIPVDPVEARLKARVAELEQPLPPDGKLVRLQRALQLSEQQLGRKRVTAAQDIAWALINSPEFLYNH